MKWRINNMQKLEIVFNDNSKITYIIRNGVDWRSYFQRHSESSIKRAILQKYPLKKNNPIVLV
jgi:hypothetical protein